jgi:alginate O-acetyltransferase complex protein AlgJ
VREIVSRSRFHKAWVLIGSVALFLPAATTNLFGDGLAGYEPGSPAPQARISDWLDRTFQTRADLWWKERFGMRFFFVKINNQINYTLFERVYEGTNTVVFGKDGWLYESPYIASYCETAVPMPDDELRDLFTKVKTLQDELDARGVPFLLLITPSKVALYPERIPDGNCEPHDGGGADYDHGLPMLREMGVRHVDSFAVTEAAMPLWPQVTLFTEGGTHWNNLGAFYTAARILEVADEINDRHVPRLELVDVVIDEKPTGPDIDLVNYLNLLFPPTRFPTAHPEVVLAPSPDRPLRAVFIGMSFLEELILVYAQTEGFEQLDHYWYYHHEVRDGLGGPARPVDRETVDWENEVFSADILVLDINMVTFNLKHARDFLDDSLAWLAANPDFHRNNHQVGEVRAK